MASFEDPDGIEILDSPSKEAKLSSDAKLTKSDVYKHPLQDQWPPRYLGIVPVGKDSGLDPPAFLEPVKHCSLPTVIPANKLVDDPADNPLLEIWSATFEVIGEERYLVLPPRKDGKRSAWHDSHNGKYPSDKIYVRDSYDQAFSILLRSANGMAKKMCHLALGGTSGLGKSFFFRYIIWRLLHPDGEEVTEGPDTILLRNDPKDTSGYLYHAGCFYTVTSIGSFLPTPIAANWLSHKNAWIICDGAPPQKYMHCPTVVLSSPGNFQANDTNGAKKYFKCAVEKVYLPPWSSSEIWVVARDIHMLTDEQEDRLLERFQRYGGIPRAVLQNFYQDLKPLKDEFILTDIITALNEVGSEEINHTKVSGKILHMIPNEHLAKVTYQWASTRIMETAFEHMFTLTKNKTQCLLHGAMSLQLGTFYGLLFEPYFHRRVCEQGYKGRMRKLIAPSTDATDADRAPDTSHAMTVKRHWYGGKKLESEVFTREIPVQKLNYFHIHNDIQNDFYNVPDRKNFAAVDSVAPDLGEMYQLTSAETHPIKGFHLRPLRKFFQPYLNRGEKVKLVFVVPPNRFEKFSYQNYIFPQKKRSGVTYDDEEETTVEGEQKDKAQMSVLVKEVNEWIDQYVMEVNVDPLVDTFDTRIKNENKRTFKEKFGKLGLGSKKESSI